MSIPPPSTDVRRDDVLEARRRIEGYVRHTPLLRAEAAGIRLLLKCEFMQHAGVFKTRGAFNRQLAARERGELDPETGIVVASGGNAGLAHAYVAQRLGVKATVFVPVTAPQVKVDRLTEYGAEVRQIGSEYAEAYDAARDYEATSGALFCHAYDQVEICAGAGTIAEEIFEAAPDVTTIVVAVGGGGLFSGLSAAADGRAELVAVEPQAIPTMHAALAAGAPVDVEVSGVAADSLGARRVGDIAFTRAASAPPRSVLVSDEAIVDARNELWQSFRIPAEYGAAAAYAALTSGAYQPAQDGCVAVIICGANTDLSTIANPALNPAPRNSGKPPRYDTAARGEHREDGGSSSSRGGRNGSW
ncbi:threonine/serine dehydratase [Mycolicibacterium baixiangningiae]|uniref:threonine/serine dehydratase n=1 Tax=Mycolicibacterium baixiangningiae TaxID=2761578 RepID=UPI001E3F1F33|nr:threonine/serine dehydratase [Mycolicibacterium baixiangningiae]